MEDESVVNYNCFQFSIDEIRIEFKIERFGRFVESYLPQWLIMTVVGK